MARTTRNRTQDCTRGDAIARLRQAESFLEVAGLVVDSDDDIAGSGVAAALAVLAGIAASDAACCARLKVRPRSQNHMDAVPLLATVRPHGAAMAKDLQRLLTRKDDAHYGLHMVGPGDAHKMVDWAQRIVTNARKVLESA